ncbi:MAG TPA: hypothetical protein VLH10_04765 [Yinghuangia sp.]|nr:hypothetical protein [Yinghuangia sp.]
MDAVLEVSDLELVLAGTSDRSTKLPVQTFESWQVIPVRAANGDTVYVNAGLPVYPVRLVTGGVEPIANNYDKFNDPLVVNAPPAAQVIDLDSA